MDTVIEFIGNHILLSSAFVLTLVAYIVLELRSAGGGSRVNPQQATDMINREKGVMLDIRPAGEFKAGHIIGAINMPLDEISNKINKLNKYKQQPIIIYDEYGQKSGSALQTLKGLGFMKLKLLAGGLVAWREANLPVVSKG